MIHNSPQGPRGHTYNTKQPSRAYTQTALKGLEDTHMIQNSPQGPRGHTYDTQQPSRA